MTTIYKILRFLLMTVAGLVGYAISARAAGASPEVKPGPESIFGQTTIHKIEVNLTSTEWYALQSSTGRGDTTLAGEDYKDVTGRLIHIGSGFGGLFPWAHIDARIDGKEFKDVGLRYRGNGSFSASSGAAPFRANLKLKVDLFGTKGNWGGENTLNFNAGTVDGSLMRESIAFAMFRAAGVPAPRTSYADIVYTVPSLYDHAHGGFYTVIENVNNQFLKTALPPGGGLLMKPEGTRGGVQSQGIIWASYLRTFRPERTATLHEQQRVMEFAQLISQTDVALFRSKIGTYLDIDEFLRFIAVNAFMENWDSYLTGNHNYYLYLDPKDDKFRFIPWDEDLSMGSRGMGQPIDMMTPMRGDNPLIYWLLDDPAVKTRYRGILTELSKTAFSKATLAKMMDQIEAALGPRPNSPRSYIEYRAGIVEQLVAGFAADKAAK